jgi:hypothetical protein
VLGALGYDAARIDGLFAQGVVEGD